MTASALLMRSTYALSNVGAAFLARQLLTVTSGPLAEALRARLRLSGTDHVDAPAVLSSHRLVHAQRPLAQNAAPIRSERPLRKLGQPSRQRHSFDQGRARRRQPLDEADAKSLDRVHRGAGGDP